MKKLIINADDFGLSKSVNNGIMECYRDGIVRSTTIMANMPGFTEAVRQAKLNPGLGVGVHLNIYRGEALTEMTKIKSLLNNEGHFYASLELVKRIYCKEIKLSEVTMEFKAQITRVKESGIKITHLDSEKHFHAFPIIAEAVAHLAHYFKINKVRLPRERWVTREVSDLISPQFYKMQYLNLRAKKMLSLFKKHQIQYVDNFFGILYSGKINLQALIQLLEKVPDGNSELMVHPGYVDQELEVLAEKYNNYLLDSREKERKILTSDTVLQKVKDLEIKLINYDDL